MVCTSGLVIRCRMQIVDSDVTTAVIDIVVNCFVIQFISAVMPLLGSTITDRLKSGLLMHELLYLNLLALQFPSLVFHGRCG